MFDDYERDTGHSPATLRAAVRDRGLLESALAIPRQPYYSGLTRKAGALLRSMVKNHPFVPGNKRLGMATTFAFLLLNRRLMTCSNEEMVAFALRLAASDPAMRWEEVAAWVEHNSCPLADVQDDAQRMRVAISFSALTDAVSEISDILRGHMKALARDGTS